MRLTAPILVFALFTSVPLYAQRTRVREDASDWLEDCRDRTGRWGGDDDRARHCELRRTAVRAGSAQLAIDAGPNGAISVVGGDVDSVVVVAKIVTQAESDSEAADLAKQVSVQVSSTSVSAKGPSTHGRRSWWVSFDITVPRALALSAETTNGPISLEGLSGRVEARAVNGPVSVYDMSGDVTGRTQNGPITAELRGSKWNGRGLDLETQNGPVTLRIADGYNAHLETGTVNGPMRFDFPVTVQGRITKRLSVDLGSGGPTIRAVTTNGPVTVRRM
ncbi:MAG: hypothetical protein HOQ11_03985 [Gemmatimonadaceae bacterium]|nr:hypothetical protein [Gemmatimonadaceae bacterium]NUQ94296.1 hypothetical protein [Gemmatimonadaceae bacterium]NUS96551.1 hypothetical protein [Gemmatimonadaceae bacterium]